MLLMLQQINDATINLGDASDGEYIDMDIAEWDYEIVSSFE